MSREATKPASSTARADKYESMAAGLPPESKLAFRQANLARLQAEAAYEEAERAAEDERRKPERAFQAAKEAYLVAVDRLTGDGGAVGAARDLLDRLQREAGEMKEKVTADRNWPEEGKQQVAVLQATLDEFKASVAAVANQIQSVDEASLALRKLSDPQDGPEFNPGDAILNKMADLIAKEQKQLSLAQAQIPLDAAWDAFELKMAELEGSQSRRIQ